MKARIAFLLFATLGFTITALPAFTAQAHAATPRTCAAINNITNNAWWRVDGKLVVAHYTRDDGTPLVFDKPVPRAVRLAEAKLSIGTPGPKVRRACA